MARARYRGDAPSTQESKQFTITGNDVTTTYKVTINGKTISVVGQAGGVNATATALQALLAGTTAPPEFKERSWTVNAATITGTMTSANSGMPGDITVSVSGGAGTISAVSTVTANSGPSDISLTANWDREGVAALPQDGDDIEFDVPVDVKWNLEALAEVDPASVTFSPQFGTKQAGLPVYNPAGYFEYRPRYLKFKGGTVTANCASGLLRLDSSDAATTLVVKSTGQPAESNRKSLSWKGTNAANTAQLNKGSVGIAELAGETAVLATLNSGYTANVDADVDLYCGAGLTWTTFVKTGGKAVLNSGGGLGTTFTHYAGECTVAVGNLTSPTIYGGNVFYTGVGTLTTPKINTGGSLDLSKENRACAISGTMLLYKGSKFNDPGNRAGNYAFRPVDCTMADVTYNGGFNKTYTLS